MSSVPERIERAITARGLSLRAASLRAGLGATTLGKIVQRRSAGVRPDVLRKISSALAVNYLWLATGEGPDGLDAPMSGPDTPPPPEPTLEREEQSEYSDDRAPVLRNLPNWRRLEDAARVLAPEVPDWVWARVREAPPLPQLVSAGAIADLARLHMRYLTEPDDR